MKRFWTGLILCLALVFGGVFAACTSTGNQAVNDVTAMIDEIGEVSDVTLDSQAAIDAARSAYDALSEEDKAEVSNYADLQAAEAELSVLQDIDALTLTITSAASMKSGAEYTPSLSGYEYNDVQTTVAWSVADVGTTGASVADDVVTATGIGRFTLIATVSYRGHNIENQAAITVEVGGYTVSGTIVFPEGNENLASCVSVRSTFGIVGQVTVGEDGIGVFTVGVPQGDTTLIFSAPAFEDVTLELENVQADNAHVGEAEFSAYRYTNGAIWAPAEGRVTQKDGDVTVGALDDGNAYATLAFADVRGTQVYLQATISNIYAAHDQNAFDVGFAPILLSEDSYAYEVRQNFTGTAYEEGIARLQGNASNPWVSWVNGTGNIVFQDTNGAWLNKDIPENESGLIEDVTVTLTMIRDGNKVYVWTQLAGEETIYHGVDVLDEKYADYEAGFGLFTRAGTGATFSDISFSTDAEFIAEKLQGSVTLTAETGADNANGSVVLQDAQGETIASGATVMLGEEVTVVITPTANTQTDIYYISAATLNDENILDRLKAQQDGSYTYTFTVRGDVSVQVTIAKEVLKTVTGKITLPVGYEYLLAEGTVRAEGVAPTAIYADGTYSLNIPAETQKIVVTLPGFSKEASLNTAQVQSETLNVELTTADYAFEWGYFTSGGTYTAEDGTVKINAKVGKDLHTAVTFADLSASSFLLRATISDIYEGDKENAFDVGFTLAFDGYNVSYELRQSGVLSRMHHGGNVWKLDPVSDRNWTGKTFAANDSGLFEGLSIDLILVRDGSTVHFWANGLYLGSDDASSIFGADTLCGFGLYTRASVGATFSNISFSTDSKVIAEQLQGSVTLNAQTGADNANGTVVLRDADGKTIESGAALALGSEVTVVITPKANTETEVYSITNFTVDNVNIPIESLTLQDGSYIYTFTVVGDTQVKAGISVAQSVRVAGTVTVPERNGNLLADGTITAGIASANIGADGAFEIIVPEDTTELTVTVPGFTAKKVALVLTDGENEHAIEQAIALTAADYAFEQGGTSNRQEWENVNGSVVVNKTTSDIISVVTVEDVESNTFFLTMTVSNIYVGRNANTFDVGFSIWNGSKVLSYEVRESGNIARFSDAFGWNNGGWIGSSVPGLANLGTNFGTPDENGLYVGVSITMTMVYQNGQVYLWVGETYLGVAGIPDGYLSANDVPVQFGAFTRAGTGATFSDISFSTDSSVVAEYLAQNVPVEN